MRLAVNRAKGANSSEFPLSKVLRRHGANSPIHARSRGWRCPLSDKGINEIIIVRQVLLGLLFVSAFHHT